MWGWSTAALRLVLMHKLDPSTFTRNKGKCDLISVEDVVKEIDKLPRTRRRGPSACPSFSLKASTIRPYQWEAVRAAHKKSGFIIAPCGAGKTLIGLLAATGNGGRFLVLTSRYAEQWRQTLSAHFCPVGSAKVAILGQDAIRLASPPDVIIATYSGLSARSTSIDARALRFLPYHTLVLDEAHAAASPNNLAVVDSIFASHVLALTATKVREDAELEKLEERIGGTLVAIDRTRLVKEGFVSDVRCINLVVPYGGELEATIGRTASLALDSNKIQVLCSTLRRLDADSHKTLVFCDDLFCLHWANRMVTAFGIKTIGCVSMQTAVDQRATLIQTFGATEGGAILFVSRTGDEALDVPNATAGLVFWNHWGSRRQMVQRLGRIARISDGGPPPTFIVLLAQDETEMERSEHRERYVKEHGFCCQTAAQDTTVFGTLCRQTNATYVKRVATEWKEAGRKIKGGGSDSLHGRPARKRRRAP